MSVIGVRLDKLAQNIGAELHGNGDIFITQVASIKQAQIGNITFLANSRFRHQLSFCKASAVILSRNNLDFCHIPAALVVDDPYFAYIKVVHLLNTTSKLITNIASSAIIAPDAVLGKEINIGDYVIIESGVVLGDSVRIGSGCFIGKDVSIGVGTNLCSNVTIYHQVEIGEYCIIQSGTVIGSDGFGYIKRNNIWIKIPQLGRIKIGNYVEVGACSTIDRGTLDDTYIEDRVIIDNQCQIAHNVIIKTCTAIAGGVVIAGSVIIGEHCRIGGASVINGHINICDWVTITGMSMVIKSIVKPGVYSSGIPAQANITWRRTTVLILRICNINKYIKMLEKKINYVFYCMRVISIIYFFIFLGLIGLILLMQFFLDQG